ncbi:PIN domain-containing protein [Gilvimarinus polysaccharolyticus]|uniref:PIN domain-containing protein n=1 Tax=Gilvimarinus polysaccharolyticus TaxID=863921 RepID=UPI000673B4E3|nr:PIN domain-containing protein [Gilvimarinus polysaccharolyticus]
MKWAFVDYENIGSLGKVDLSSYARVIVFLGAKQPKLDFTDTKYDRPINLVVIQLKAVQANNLDFHLAYYLGKFDSEAPAGVAFDVISNDGGFSPLIGHIKTSGRACKQVKIANTSLDTQKLIDSLMVRPKDKRPQKVISLRNHIASHLRIKGNEVAIQNQLNQLVSANLISLNADGVEYKK